jgi:hypothetical protein
MLQPFLLSLGNMFFQQATGINFVMSYTVTIFQVIGVPPILLLCNCVIENRISSDRLFAKFSHFYEHFYHNSFNI